MDKLQIRIPEGTVTPEEFIAIRTQLRMLFGVPAEVIPDTHVGMCIALSRLTGAHPLFSWLVENGYEVVQDYGSKTQRMSYLIRLDPANSLGFGAEAVSAKIRGDIDKTVINTLLGRVS
jgi:hypothetical protein